MCGKTGGVFSCFLVPPEARMKRQEKAGEFFTYQVCAHIAPGTV